MCPKMNVFLKNTLYLLFFLFLSRYSIAIEGKVFDQVYHPVANARIEFTRLDDSTVKYSVLTNQDGTYRLELPLVDVQSANAAVLFPVYPNPVADYAVISFLTAKKGKAIVNIYNINGQMVDELLNEDVEAGIYQFTWSRTIKNGVLLPSGLYLIRLSFISGNETEVRVVKMLCMGNFSTSPQTGFLPPTEINFDTFAIGYKVTVTKDSFETFSYSYHSLIDTNELNFMLFRKYAVPYACTGNYLGIWNGKDYTPLFIKGINLGVSKPGTSPGELAATNEDYKRWFEKISELGFNLIRVYTLHFPRFYEELYKFNMKHASHPIYLIQGVWLDEETGNDDLFSQSQKFDDDIEEVLDCVYGKRKIDERFGRAYGNFTYDVSKWVMAYIIGREIHPYEVRATNANHPADTFFTGNAVSIYGTQPFDAWLTARVDHLITYERNTYQKERPVSCSSWPTLDPMRHPSEKFTEEDTSYSNLDIMIEHHAPAGYFASYHAYPYYPDFISQDTNYQKFSDTMGRNSYLGYLTDLKNHYAKRPLIIAEYGVPSSWGNAHFSYSGMHHGGHDEVVQGLYDVRLLNNIYEAGCGGGILFSWIDEWFKRTWIVDPISTQGERRNLWHNVTSPEQNFGLIAFEPVDAPFSAISISNNSCNVKNIKWSYNFEFLKLEISLKNALKSGDSLFIGIDTYKSNTGESVLPDGKAITNRAEFSMKIKYPDVAEMYVTEAYDLFAIWHKQSKPEQLYHSIATDGAPWKLIRWKNNRYDTSIFYIGKLRMRNASQPASTLDAIVIDNNVLKIRIPWTLLQFTDPTLMEVMDDLRSTPQRETSISDGIALSVSMNNCVTETQARIKYPSWNAVSSTMYFEREKASMKIVSEGIKKLPLFIE